MVDQQGMGTSAEAAIGELSMVFQELENSLVWLFARLTDPHRDAVGMIIATQLPFKRLAAVISALLRYRTKEPDLIQQCDDILGEAQPTRADTQHVHSFILRLARDFRCDDTYERMKNRIRPGKGSSPDYEMLDTEKLGKVVERFRIHISAVDLFFEHLQNRGVITR